MQDPENKGDNLQDPQNAGVMSSLELWETQAAAGGFCLNLLNQHTRCVKQRRKLAVEKRQIRSYVTHVIAWWMRKAETRSVWMRRWLRGLLRFTGRYSCLYRIRVVLVKLSMAGKESLTPTLLRKTTSKGWVPDRFCKCPKFYKWRVRKCKLL